MSEYVPCVGIRPHGTLHDTFDVLLFPFVPGQGDCSEFRVSSSWLHQSPLPPPVVTCLSGQLIYLHITTVCLRTFHGRFHQPGSFTSQAWGDEKRISREHSRINSNDLPHRYPVFELLVATEYLYRGYQYTVIPSGEGKALYYHNLPLR